jgi:hypothetical protein
MDQGQVESTMCAPSILLSQLHDEKRISETDTVSLGESGHGHGHG